MNKLLSLIGLISFFSSEPLMAGSRILQPDSTIEYVFVQNGDGEGANYGSGRVRSDSVLFSRDWEPVLLRKGKDIYILESAYLGEKVYFGVVLANNINNNGDCEIPLLTKTAIYSGPCEAGWVDSENVEYLGP